QRARRPARLADQLVQDRQQERDGLAAPGHRAGEDVLAFESRWNRVGLDRRGPDEPEVLQTAEQVGVKLELAERLGAIVCRQSTIIPRFRLICASWRARRSETPLR